MSIESIVNEVLGRYSAKLEKEILKNLMASAKVVPEPSKPKPKAEPIKTPTENGPTAKATPKTEVAASGPQYKISFDKKYRLHKDPLGRVVHKDSATFVAMFDPNAPNFVRPLLKKESRDLRDLKFPLYHVKVLKRDVNKPVKGEELLKLFPIVKQKSKTEPETPKSKAVEPKPEAKSESASESSEPESKSEPSKPEPESESESDSGPDPLTSEPVSKTLSKAQIQAKALATEAKDVVEKKDIGSTYQETLKKKLGEFKIKKPGSPQTGPVAKSPDSEMLDEMLKGLSDGDDSKTGSDSDGIEVPKPVEECQEQDSANTAKANISSATKNVNVTEEDFRKFVDARYPQGQKEKTKLKKLPKATGLGYDLCQHIATNFNRYQEMYPSVVQKKK